jgi:peflin
MYQPPYQQQQQGYQQATPGGYPPGSPVGGYQVGPPGSYGAPPPQGAYPAYGQPGYNANQPPAQRPTSAQPPAGVDPQLFNLFRAADTNGSGQLSERELSRALVNGDFSPFDARTVKLMVKMFDVDQ